MFVYVLKIMPRLESGYTLQKYVMEAFQINCRLIWKASITYLHNYQWHNTMFTYVTEFQCSPIHKLVTPEKCLRKLLSPSKSGCTVNTIDFTPDEAGDMFSDDWDIGEIEEVCISV